MLASSLCRAGRNSLGATSKARRQDFLIRMSSEARWRVFRSAATIESDMKHRWIQVLMFVALWIDGDLRPCRSTRNRARGRPARAWPKLRRTGG